MESDIFRFSSRYLKEPITGCWLWVRGKDRKGYGKFRVNKKQYRAHRWIWAYYNGSIPKDMQVLHKCDTPACVNPSHLFLGTHQDNMEDRNQKGRQAKGNRSGVHTMPHTRCYGARSAKTKLNWGIVDSIRTDKETLSNRAIAKKYKISCGQVNKIINNVQWKEEYRHLSEKGVYGE